MPKCDSCGNGNTLKKIHIQTGKRGRPPIKFYCDPCIEKAGSNVKIAENGNGDRPRVTKALRITPQEAPGKSLRPSEPRRRGRPPGSKNNNQRLVADGFNPAATFLLSMLPENLFEPANTRESIRVRCKGCGSLVKLSERNSHFQDHKAKVAA